MCGILTTGAVSPIQRPLVAVEAVKIALQGGSYERRFFVE